MIKLALIFIGLIGSVLSEAYTQEVSNYNQKPQIDYIVDLTNLEDDLFHVNIQTSNLTIENGIYNFAATAPGTYEVLDFGRYVQSFQAFDLMGVELFTERISINQWKIYNPDKLASLSYTIEDSYDSEIQSHEITPMCGTCIQQDFVVFNTFGVLGYFENLQSNPVRLKVKYNSDWKIGTAMDIDENGFYLAETYDRLADSPILLGDLAIASTKVKDIDVEIYAYASDTSLVSVDTILAYVEDVLQSAGNFINYSPVKYYKFLLVLLDYQAWEEIVDQIYAGALEHSYSSLFVYPLTPEEFPEIKSDMAHEFMHILTPLNLHSEIIHNYNFAIPTASEHLWLYEGVTEWASDIIQLRGSLITLEEYLDLLTSKLKENDTYNPELSLSKISLNVYDDEILDQFANFYERGAIVAALMDIKLLELSDGKKGLREIYLELLNRYGKDLPFPENELFDILVEMTYPEVRDFINDYIRGSEQLPCKEIFAKIGINYFAEKLSDDKRPTFDFSISTKDRKKYYVTKTGRRAYLAGIRDGDIILKLMGQKVNSGTINEIIEKRNSANVGDSFEIVVKRGKDKNVISLILLPKMDYHVFEIIEDVSVEKKTLREKWIRNL